MTSILVTAIIAMTAARMYQKRDILKALTKQEWQQYIIGFFVAWGTAVAIIFGGVKVLNVLHIETFRLGFGILFILIGLVVARTLFDRLVPARVKEIYK